MSLRIGRGLVDSGQEKALKMALGLRAYFDAIRNNQLEVLNSAIAKYPEAISNVDPVWGTPAPLGGIDFLIREFCVCKTDGICEPLWVRRSRLRGQG